MELNEAKLKAQKIADKERQTVYVSQIGDSESRTYGTKSQGYRITRQSELSPLTAHCAQFEVKPNEKALFDDVFNPNESDEAYVERRRNELGLTNEVFVYQASLLCNACGQAKRKQLNKAGKSPANPDAEDTYDSDEYPKGPYPNGGGESDSPQHCDCCGKFLRNPLTSDGIAYLREVTSARYTQHPIGRLIEWEEFYRGQLEG